MADQQSAGSKKLDVDRANVSFMARLRRATRLSICPLIGQDQKFPADRQTARFDPERKSAAASVRARCECRVEPERQRGQAICFRETCPAASLRNRILPLATCQHRIYLEALNAVLVEHSEIRDPFFTWSGRGTGNMDEQLRTVTVRIAHVAEGGVRAWSDDLKGLSLTCANHDALFAQLTPTIASLLEQQGLSGRIVREIHQFIMEIKQI